MYDWGGEFLGQELKNNLIERDYGVKTKPYSSGNPQANATIDRIHQVLGDLVRTYNLHETYVDTDNPWMGILAEDAFVIRSTYHRTKGKIPGQIVFDQDMILPINHILDWKYIRQSKQEQIEK